MSFDAWLVAADAVWIAVPLALAAVSAGVFRRLSGWAVRWPFLGAGIFLAAIFHFGHPACGCMDDMPGSAADVSSAFSVALLFNVPFAAVLLLALLVAWRRRRQARSRAAASTAP